MHIILAGINLLKTPVSLREKIAISPGKLSENLQLLKKAAKWGIILSTCNRVEIYTVVDNADCANRVLREFLTSRLKLIFESSSPEFYFLADNDAALHLLRVASGLESVIVGECEILGQIKHALLLARKNKTVNPELEFLFQNALRIGKLVREKTHISQNAISISSLALQLVEEIQGSFKGFKLLVIGAGEAGRLVAQIAISRGVSNLVIANRTLKRAEKLTAKLGGVPIGHEDVMKHLVDSDVLITCSGAPHRTLDFERVTNVMKSRSNPLLVIDIGVPRNVDPAIGSINNVSLHDIDDLLKLSEINRVQRESEIGKVEKILFEELKKFSKKWSLLTVKPLIAALVSKFESERILQMKKSSKKFENLSMEERNELELMTKALVSKILSAPINCLKNKGRNGFQELVKELFQLNENTLP
jgi:glutamyl-tRNA reductase